MPDFLIRKATIDDAKKIAEIKIDGWRIAYRGIIADDYLNSMDIKIESEKRRTNIENGVPFIVADLEGEIVGFCVYIEKNEYIEKYQDADCEISAIYVKSELKRKGIGRELMLHVINNFKNKNKNKMIICCLKDNYPSRVFYEKMGGKVINYDEIEIGNKNYEIAVYEYDIVNM